MQKYFTLGALGWGLDLDLRVLPPQAAASGNLRSCPHGIEVKKDGFRTTWLITGQILKFQEVWLILKAFILTCRDPFSLLCQNIMRVAV